MGIYNIYLQVVQGKTARYEPNVRDPSHKSLPVIAITDPSSGNSIIYNIILFYTMLFKKRCNDSSKNTLLVSAQQICDVDPLLGRPPTDTIQTQDILCVYIITTIVKRGDGKVN